MWQRRMRKQCHPSRTRVYRYESRAYAHAIDGSNGRWARRVVLAARSRARHRPICSIALHNREVRMNIVSQMLCCVV